LVVEELLRRGRAAEVVALVRNATKAAEVLPQDARVRIVEGGEDVGATIAAQCEGAQAAIWCSDGTEGLSAMGATLRGSAPAGGPPRLVLCSSAAVTRPTWAASRKARFPGAADIPIVRLNPNDILGQKRAAEDTVRQSGTPYVVLRPTGLSENWSPGRPLFSQGDLAVGRTTREDLATVLVSMLDEKSASGKTVEMLSVPGYPKPESYEPALAPLRRDASRGLLARFKQAAASLFGGSDSSADEATYNMLQQLLPGESQNSAGLAMGQTYEQYDRREEGRLGPRGEERVPATIGK